MTLLERFWDVFFRSMKLYGDCVCVFLAFGLDRIARIARIYKRRTRAWRFPPIRFHCLFLAFFAFILGLVFTLTLLEMFQFMCSLSIVSDTCITA